MTTVTKTSAPTGVSGTGGGSFVNLSWTASPGTSALITYTIGRSSFSGGSYTTVTSGVSGTTYTDNTVTTGSTYYYVIYAVTSGGNSSNSTQITVVPISTFNITSITSSPNQLILNWGVATGATSYTVKQSTSSGGSITGTNVTGCVSISTTTCTVTSLINNTTYYYTVFANNTGVNATASTNTSEGSSTPLSNSLTVTSVGSGQVSFSWSSITNATSYSIYYSTTSGNAVSGGAIVTGCNAISSATTSCTATGLINGSTYYFALVAPLSTGGSFQGSEVLAIPIGSFNITSLTAASTSSANITWATSSGATNYLIQYGLVTGTYTGSQGPTTSLSATVTSLSAGNIYFFRVKAQNIYGSVLSSTESQVTLPTTAPTGLSLTSLTSSTVNLNWNASPGNSAITYKMSRSIISGSGYVAVSSGGCNGTLVTNSCSDNSVASGSTYYYVITATNSAGTTVNSTQLSVTTPPVAPASLTGVSLSATQNQLTWSAITGSALGTTYTISRSTTMGGSYSPIVGCTAITLLSCTDSSVSAGTNYYYVVTATNAGGTSSNSTELSLITYTTAPTTLTATSAGTSQVNLSWSLSPGSVAITYSVFRSTTSGGPYTALTTGACATAVASPTVSCQDTSAQPGFKYYYVVQASTIAGASANSVPSSATTATTSPTNLSGVAGSTTSVTLTWSASPGNSIITYTVLRSSTNGSGYSAITLGTCNTGITSPTVTCTDTNASAGNIYYYVVYASNSGGTTTNSSQAIVVMPTTAPTNLIVSSVTSSSVTLTWTASPGNSAITYNMLRSSTNGSGYASISTGSCSLGITSPTVTCTDTSVTSGNIYYYVVTASNSTATTSNSNQATATTPAAAPTNLAGNANSPTSVTLTWTASLGNSTITYNMLRSSTMGSGYTSIGTGTCSSSITSPTVTCTDTNVTAGNIYYYVVTATNIGGVSSNSTEATVTTPTTAPTGLMATATSTTNVNLSWTASPGNSTITYMVYRSLTNGSGYVAVNSPTCTSAISSISCTDTTASAGNLYFYVVTATNSAATTSNSSSSNTTTQTTAPTGLTATISSATSINISWTASSGNANMTYNVKRSIVSGSSYTGITSGVCSGNVNSPTVSCSDLSPISGNTYFYIVTVKNAFNVTLTSAAEVSIVFSPPTNTVAPSISGTGYTASSGIISATGNVLTANQGTWGGGPTSSCTNHIRRNKYNIHNSCCRYMSGH